MGRPTKHCLRAVAHRFEAGATAQPFYQGRAKLAINVRRVSGVFGWPPSWRASRASQYGVAVAALDDFRITFDSPDEDGWIVARVLEVPGAMSQGRTRQAARQNALDALRVLLTPDDELAGRAAQDDPRASTNAAE